MITLPSSLIRLVAIHMASLLLVVANANAGFGTTVPVTAEVASSIANSVFPQTLTLDDGSLFVSEPVVLYPELPAAKQAGKAASPPRISLQVNVQVLARQPDQSLKASAPGTARLSGEVGYDRETAQILLINPQIDSLEFHPTQNNAEQMRTELTRNWDERMSNPLRIDVPAHPYLLPFKQGIRDISFQQQGIVVDVWFE